MENKKLIDCTLGELSSICGITGIHGLGELDYENRTICFRVPTLYGYCYTKKSFDCTIDELKEELDNQLKDDLIKEICQFRGVNIII